MKLKTSIIAFVFVLFAAFCSSAADAKAKTVALKDPTALYQAGEWQVEALAFTETANLNDYDSGGGAAVTYWHWEQIGVGLETKTFDPDHAFFDRIGLNLAGRAPIQKLGIAGIGRIGFDWQAEQVRNPRRNEFDVYVALGIEKRIAKVWTIGAEIRGTRAAKLAPKEALQGVVRVGRVF